MKQFLCILCVGSLCVAAQENLDAVVAQLSAALASNNTSEVHRLEQKLLSAPASLSTLLAAGFLLAQQEKMSEASAVFERCSQQFPSSFEAKYNLALARIALTQYQSALDTLNSLSPPTADEKAAVQYLTGKIFLNTNHLKEAQEKLASAYAQRPKEENYALDLALLYIRSAAYVQAIRVLEPSLVVHPASEDLALELALSQVLAGNYSEGIALCRKLQLQDPPLGIPSLIAAFAYCAQKSFQSCEAEASAGLASPHPNPYLYYLRAQAGWESGSTEQKRLLEDVSMAIRQMPACRACLLLRSRMFEASGDNGSAITDIKRAVEGDTQDAADWYRLSVLYRKEGRSEEASAALRHYRSLHENGSNEEVESFRNQFLDAMGNH
jgi:predicted Zn-dependent protease